MILLLSTMLVLTFLGALTLKREDKSEEETIVEPVAPTDDTKKVPTTFKGKIDDDFSVEKEVMDLIVSYMDAYYKSLYTLEKEDMSSPFSKDRDSVEIQILIS